MADHILSIVTYNIFPAKQGGQLSISFFNQFLSKKVNLVCATVKSNSQSFVEYPIYPVLSNSALRYINPFIFFSLKRIIKKHQISHVILEHPYFGWMGLLLKYFLGIKLIIHSHNIEAQRFRSTGKWWWKILFYYEKWIHQKADYTFCITEEDRNYFHEQYKIPYKKSAVITYGIPFEHSPSDKAQQSARKALLAKHQLPENVILYFFNGALQYLPNQRAVEYIVKEIQPRMAAMADFDFRILICGKGLSVDLQDQISRLKNVIYAGFVEDIGEYYRGADVFINPVVDGGGIKTKLVEALANNLNCISTLNGALGIPEQYCNGKLSIVANDDWQGFAQKMIRTLDNKKDIPASYFQHFYWGDITQKAKNILEKL